LAGGKPSICVDGLLDDIDGSLASAAGEGSLDQRLADASAAATADFAQVIGARTTEMTVGNAGHAGRGVPQNERMPAKRNATEDVPYSLDAAPGNQGDPPAGLVIINPLSFSRRVSVDASALDRLPDTAGGVLRGGETSGRKSIVVEVPPLGFLCAAPGSGHALEAPAPRRLGLFRKAPPPPLPMAELVAAGGAVLRNEFFELVIDPHTGAIRSIFDYHSRAPRLSQQVALRLPGAAGDEDAYSIMAADEIRVPSAGPLAGEVVVRGRLVDRSAQVVAGFQQSTRVVWGSRVIDVDIELDPQRQPDGEPWNSYYAARFAWGQDAPTLYRSVNQATLASEAEILESPYFVEIRAAAGRTAVLAAGLPYHRRRGPRRLDSLLLVRGETARRFRLGIAIDVAQPMAAALDFMSPSPTIPVAARPGSDSAWLFHLDARTVIATHWEAMVEDGSATGFRVRLLETEGRHVSLVLRSFRAIRSAQKAGGGDRPAIDLGVEGDRITIPFRPYEWAEVQAAFEH